MVDFKRILKDEERIERIIEICPEADLDEIRERVKEIHRTTVLSYTQAVDKVIQELLEANWAELTSLGGDVLE